MRLFLVWVLFLGGCAWPGGQSLDDYILSNKIDQEQKNSSVDSDSNWMKTSYPSKCDWLGFGRVVDGDTIIVFDENGQIRVRMIGIDTPESKREGTPIQAYALDATRELKDLIRDPLQVCLIQDDIGDQYDVYDRRLSYVFTETGVDLNAEMLRQGWAKAYLRFPFERKSEFATLERMAKQAALGRWE